MCNLYRMRKAAAELARLFGPLSGALPNLPDYDDIYPNREAPVIRRAEGGNLIERMTWGWPPFGQIKRPITNVRNLDSKFWKSALADPSRRCLVPVTSFCEWEGEKGHMRKVWFGLADREVFAFAGIWRPTEDGPRMAFLTCEPNETVGAVHPKAMPVILRQEDEADWLTADLAIARALAKPYEDAAMTVERD